MNLRKIALGLLFGGALAVGSIACDDSTTGPGDAGGGATLPQPCATIGSDPDGASTPFVVINTLTLPAADGFNIDGINNAVRGGAGGGSGKTIAGCSVQDLAYGKDNALATLAVTLKQAGLDLNKDLTNTLAVNGGSLTIEARLTKLSAANVADDACVGVEVRVGGASGTVFNGSGSMTAHVASVSFGQSLSFDAAVKVPDSSCNGGACTPGAVLHITIDSPVASIKLNDANTQIQAGSLIGGFIYYFSSESAYNSLNATGFQASLQKFFTDVNLSTSLQQTALSTFEGAQDLHMNVDRSIGACTSPNGSASSVNRNAVSVGLAITSM